MGMVITVHHWVPGHPVLPAWVRRLIAAVRRLMADDRFWIAVLALAALVLIVWLSTLPAVPEVPGEWLQPMPGVRGYYPV